MTTWPQPTQPSWCLFRHLLLHLVPWAAPTQYPWSTGQNGNNKVCIEWMQQCPLWALECPDPRYLFNLAWFELKLLMSILISFPSAVISHWLWSQTSFLAGNLLMEPGESPQNCQTFVLKWFREVPPPRNRIFRTAGGQRWTFLDALIPDKKLQNVTWQHGWQKVTFLS